MKYLLLVLCIVFIHKLSSSQQPPGMLGKRSLISYNMTASTRLLPVIFGNNSGRFVYDEEEGVVDDPNLLRFAHNFHYLYITKRHFGVGLVYNFENLNIPSTSNLSNVQLQYPLSGSSFMMTMGIIDKMETPTFTSHTIKPSIMWTAKQSFLPVGFRNILGFGPRFTNISSRRPVYVSVLEYPDFFQDNVGLEEAVYKFPENNIPEEIDLSNTAWELSYQGLISYPVTKNLMIELGFTLRTAFGNSMDENVTNNREFLQNRLDNYIESVTPDNPLDPERALRLKIEENYYGFDYSEAISRENLFSVFSMQFGLAFAF